MSDPATFSRADMELVFGRYPRCFMCGMPAEDPNHTVSRGYIYGAKPKSERRKMFSSILNCSALCRRCHEGGQIHSPDMESYLLNETLRQVSLCDYKLKPEDKAFKKEFRKRYEILRPSKSMSSSLSKHEKH